MNHAFHEYPVSRPVSTAVRRAGSTGHLRKLGVRRSTIGSIDCHARSRMTGRRSASSARRSAGPSKGCPDHAAFLQELVRIAPTPVTPTKRSITVPADRDARLLLRPQPAACQRYSICLCTLLMWQAVQRIWQFPTKGGARVSNARNIRRNFRGCPANVRGRHESRLASAVLDALRSLPSLAVLVSEGMGTYPRTCPIATSSSRRWTMSRTRSSVSCTRHSRR